MQTERVGPPVARRALLFATVIAALLAACTRSPHDFKDGFTRAVAAQRAGDLEKAEDLYTATFRLVDKLGNDGQAVFLADLAADMALARSAPDRAIALYRRILERYPDTMRSYVGRFRIPNNLAVLLAREGHVGKGIAAIEPALDIYTGHGNSPAYPFAPRALLARNLIVMYSKRAWDSRSESAYQQTLSWLEPEFERNANSPEFTRGSGPLFRALGDLASKGPRPDEAARLYSLADVAAAREQQIASYRSVDRTPCEPREIEGLRAETCYASL
jgi:tetratricopeptide (TPR) repeat protein